MSPKVNFCLILPNSLPEIGTADNFDISGSHMKGNMGPSETQTAQLWMEKHGLSQAGQDLIVKNYTY